jgi:predicted nucleic acid-binding protein
VSRVFFDTSAAFALLVASDENHARAADAFRILAARGAGLTTTSYVLVETYALLMRRVGREACASFRDDVEPLLAVSWVDESLHARGRDFLLRSQQSRLSLVDAVSFVSMKNDGIDEAFAYDRHFEDEGFVLI